ncbi:hypothetical protein Pcar_3244 [Syntrophotalea carbinolica DSM 2380]|uniref:Uncharacterized protein n=1 Tax=Syntrophotalea carbinolica (strain DSM 2380 / NBRC 103641 / GraBd1) TaxID=338963 RepID=Q0C6S3_SYNC1|nr:hypothetical protein Pcar_3244 [Syntrophotalea carbinolica DSM 2380]
MRSLEWIRFGMGVPSLAELRLGSLLKRSGHRTVFSGCLVIADGAVQVSSFVWDMHDFAGFVI